MDRRYLAAGTTLLVFLVAAYAALAPSGDGSAQGMNWTTVELEDVESGETFTIAELEKPVLVETFAVWCPTCLRQQREVEKLHGQYSGFTSVSLDTDPNEDAAKVRQHLEKNGFGWRYAVAPTEMTAGLVQEFGSSIVNAPSAPMVIVCEDGTRRLQNGVKSASTLQAELEEGCGA